MKNSKIQNGSLLTGKLAVELLVIILVAAGAASVAAYASFPENQSQSLASTTGEYWSGEQQTDVSGRQVRAHPAVPPQTLKEKAEQLESFIGVDLEAMQLYWYQNGNVARTYPVLSKGRPGSRFETPSGQYEIGYRNKKHLSSIGDVYMPYSQQFYGNFFIHGWPYYPDGTKVEEGYSGGCIRLATADAKALFERTNSGTPIVVVGGTRKKEDSLPQPQTAVPRVNAKSYIVADIQTGHVFAQKQANKSLPIASISKLMTAVVANETIAYNDPVRISDNAVATYGLAGGLVAGERLLLKTLYYPLLLESSNDAATAIAEHHGFKRFIKLMNRKAEALDMDATQFADPSGLSDGNQSSSRDLFRLARYIHNKKRFIFDLTTAVQKTAPDVGSDGLRNFTNNNPMVGRDGFVGGKNGYTDNARHTLLSVFEAQIGDTKREVVIIVLGSETHTEDTNKLLSWLTEGT